MGKKQNIQNIDWMAIPEEETQPTGADWMAPEFDQATQSMRESAKLDPEEDEVFSNAARATKQWYQDMGGMTPAEKMDEFNFQMNRLVPNYEQDILYADTPDAMIRVNDDFKTQVKTVADQLGLDITEDGSVKPYDREMSQYLEKLGNEARLYMNTMDLDDRQGFWEFMGDKLRAGSAAFAANTLDMVGEITGLNTFENYKDLSEGQRHVADLWRQRADRYDETIQDYSVRGEYDKAAGAAVGAAIESVPAMLPMFVNPQYGVYMMGANAAMEQYRAIEDKEIPKWEKILNSVTHGANEVVWEKVVTVPILARSKQAITSFGKRQGQEIIENTMEAALMKSAYKAGGPIPDWAKEGLSEVATGLSNDVVDKLTVDPDIEIGSHAFDDMVVGSVMGRAFSAPTSILGSIEKAEQKNIIKKGMEQIPDGMETGDYMEAVAIMSEREAVDRKQKAVDENLKAPYKARYIELTDQANKIFKKYEKEDAAEVSETETKVNYLLDRGVNINNISTPEQLNEAYENEQQKESEEGKTEPIPETKEAKSEEKLTEIKTEPTDKEQTKRDDGEQKLPKKETTAEEELTKKVIEPLEEQKKMEEPEDAGKTEEKTEESVPKEGTEGGTTEQGRVRDDGKNRKEQTEEDVNKLVEELPDNVRGKITAKGIKSKLARGKKAIDKKIKAAKKQLAEEFVGGTKKVKKIKPGLEKIKEQLYKIAPRKEVDDIVKETYERDVKGIDESGYFVQDKQDGKNIQYRVKFLPNGKTTVTEITQKGFPNKNVPKGPLHNKLVDLATSQRSATFQRMFDEQIQKLEDSLYDQLYDQLADYRTGRHKDLPIPAKKGKFPEQPRKKTRTSKEPTKRLRMPSYGTKVVVDEMASFREAVKQEIKNRRLGAQRANKIKGDFIDLLNKLLRDSDVKKFHGGQVRALMGKVRKLREENMMKVLDEVIEYVEKIEQSNEYKAEVSTLEKQLGTKTQKKDPKSKRTKGAKGTERMKYYLDAANRFYKGYKDHVELLNTVVKKVPRGANQQTIKNITAFNEMKAVEVFQDWKKYLEKELIDIRLRQVSDDPEVREQALWEEQAMRDMDGLWMATTEDLQKINQNLAAIISAEGKALQNRLAREVKRRNELKDLARQQTEGRYAGMSKADIQKAKAQESKLEKLENDFLDAKNAFVKYINSPVTGSLDFLLKKIEYKASLVGKGPLYEHFMKSDRGWVQSKAEYYRRRREQTARIKEAEKKMLGQSGFKMFSKHIFEDARHGEKKIKYGQINDKTGIYLKRPGEDRSEIQESMAPAQGMYVYAVAQMEDGREKLRDQGWDDEALKQLEKFLGKKNIKFIEFYTQELFPEVYKDYNPTHIDLYATPLDKIKNFIPLVYENVGELETEGEANIGEFKILMPSSMPSSLRYRVANSREIDTTANFFTVVNNYLEEMETWYNFNEFVRDANILLTDPEVKRNLENNTPGITKLLKAAFDRAVGTDYIDPTGVERELHTLNRYTAVAQIGLKIWTAMKQMVSFLAWAEVVTRPEIRIGNRTFFVPLIGSTKLLGKILKNMVWRQPDKKGMFLTKDFQFFMKNSEFFRERWEQGVVGDEQLERALRRPSDPGVSRKKYWFKWGKQNVGRAAMILNKVMDSLAITTGGKVYYDHQYDQYKKMGYSDKKAHQQAIYDFDLQYNLAQQSSEGAFLGPVQSSPTVLKSMMATFKNSQMAYFRKNNEAILDGVGEYVRKRQQEYERLRREGVPQEKAEMKARRLALGSVKSKASLEAIRKLTLYGVTLPVAWQYILSGLPGLLTGWEDEDSIEMKRSLWFGSIDGMFLLGDMGKYIYDVFTPGRAYEPYRYLLVDKFIEATLDINKALQESGDNNMDIAMEVMRWVMIFGVGVDWENLDTIYDGAKGMIMEGKWNQENIMKFMKAPKTMIEQIGEEKKGGYSRRVKQKEKEEKESGYARRRDQEKKKKETTGYARRKNN